MWTWPTLASSAPRKSNPRQAGCEKLVAPFEEITPSALAGPGVSSPSARTDALVVPVSSRIWSNARTSAPTATSGPSCTKLGTSTSRSTRNRPEASSTVALLLVPPQSRPTTIHESGVRMLLAAPRNAGSRMSSSYGSASPCLRCRHPGDPPKHPPPTSTMPRPAAADAGSVRRMSWAEDLVTLVLAAWLIGGLFLDGWAHNTRPQLETFFTPWHAVFYSGFISLALWICWSVWRRSRVPAGYGPALLGVAIFLLSGVGDMIWHLAFGIERDIAALLSPTHLGLFTGDFLIVTAPLRSQGHDPAVGRGRRPSLGQLLPAVGSVALAGSLCAFIFLYLHPIYDNDVSLGRQAFLQTDFTTAQYYYVRRENIVAGVPGFVLSTVFLFAPLLFLLRRWRLPVGAAVVVLGLQSLLMQGLTGFQDIGLAQLGLIGAVVVAVLLRLLDPAPSSLGRLRVFCAVGPALFWGVYFAGIGLKDHGLGWSAEVWGGTLVWTGLMMLALTLLLSPSATVAETSAPVSGPGTPR